MRDCLVSGILNTATLQSARSSNLQFDERFHINFFPQKFVMLQVVHPNLALHGQQRKIHLNKTQTNPVPAEKQISRNHPGPCQSSLLWMGRNSFLHLPPLLLLPHHLPTMMADASLCKAWETFVQRKAVEINTCVALCNIVTLYYCIIITCDKETFGSC
jgi:hypothetical protein